MQQVERKYGVDSPKRAIVKNLKDYVRVERKQEKLRDSDEFLLYVLRRFTNGFCPIQDRLSEIMGVDRTSVCRSMRVLESKGFITTHEKKHGRSKWFSLHKLPTKNYNKIPTALILNTEIPWKNRLFAIKLYNEVLNDVNEIHRTKKELAAILNMSRNTLEVNIKFYEGKGIIEKIKTGYRIDVYALLSLVDDVVLQQENKIWKQGIENSEMERNMRSLQEKYDDLEQQFIVCEAQYSNPNYWKSKGVI